MDKCVKDTLEEFSKQVKLVSDQNRQVNDTTKMSNGSFLFDTSKLSSCNELTKTERYIAFAAKFNHVGYDTYISKQWDNKSIVFYKL